MYGKIFESMYDGTLRSCWQAIAVFPHLIVLADEDGIIDLTPHALHARTGIPLEIIEVAISFLEAEDSRSRTLGCGGRRLERMDSHRPWGWRIVNCEKYRLMANREDKKKADRERIARKRAADKTKQDNGVANCHIVSQPVADVAHTDTDTDTNTESGCASRFAPKDFVVTANMQQWAVKELGFRIADIELETAKFRDHEFAKPQKDFDRAWRNWMRRAHGWRKERAAESTPDTTADVAAKLGLSQRIGESEDQFKIRVRDAMIAQDYGSLQARNRVYD